MSQNATSRNRGLDRGSSKTSHTDSNKSNLKQTNLKHTKLASNSHSLDENHNSKEANHFHQQHNPAVATVEQMRLAQLIGNKNEDPEISKKIKQVLDIVPNRKQDDILMMLHENDYDVAKTIEYLLDGGDLTDDWKTAGKQKKAVTSPNKDEEADTKSHAKFRQNGKTSDTNRHMNGDRGHHRENGQQKFRGDRTRRGFEGRSNRRTENNNGHLEEKMASLDFQDVNDNQGEHAGGQKHQLANNINNNQRRTNGHARGGMRGGGRGGRGGRGGPVGDRQNGRAGGGGGRNQARVDRPDRQRDTESRNTEEISTLISAKIIEAVDPLDVNVAVTNAAKELENNLRDIGTWSNEQAASDSANNNRRPNKSNYLNNGNSSRPEDPENEEEWQGDLSQTQIFTATSQVGKKEETDFPIGHFNTEEAAQNIKNAIGIVTMGVKSVEPNVSATVHTKPASEPLNVNTKQNDKPQLQATATAAAVQQNIRLGSVKPPPPSTKIPKSAVVMPGGGNNNNGFNLDVQFGVDLETSIPKTKPEVIKEPINVKPVNTKNTATNQAAQQQQQAATKRAPKDQPPPIVSLPQLNTYENNAGNNKPLTNTTEHQKIGVVNPVVVSKQVVGSSATKEANLILNNLPLDASNVLAALPKVDLAQMTNANSTQQTFVVQPERRNEKQMSQEPKKTSPKPDNQFIGDAQKQQKQYMQFQNQLQQQQQQQLGNLSQTTSKSSSSTSQHSGQHQSAANNKQYLNQLNQEVTSGVAALNNQGLNTGNMNTMSATQQSTYQLNSMSNSQMESSNSSQNINSGPSQSSSSQLLNQISPQNSQKQQTSTLNPNNAINTSTSSSSTASTGVNKQASINGSNTAMPPPPGVNMINPQNNQFMMGLPFQQQFPYFDPSQMDGNSIMQMYNHLAGVAPPGVGSASGAGGATPGVPYSINDTKFNRSQDTAGSNSQLNPNAQLSQQQQQQQQQQPINMIPGLSNFPFFFHNYYPNMFMSMPQNGPQQQGNPQQQQQQFQNKPPYNNFNNNNSNSVSSSSNGVNDYEVQGKDYNTYNQQSQIKNPGSNLNAEITAYQKNVDKTNTGYHTPPPNYSNSLMNQQQQHPNVAGNSGGPLPPNQYAYINSMIGAQGGNPNNPLANQHGMQQENVGSRGGLGNNGSSSIKQLQKTANYQNSPWS